MTRDEIEASFDDGDLDSEYAEYIMSHGGGGPRVICNGDTLLSAMEARYLAEEFIDFMMSTKGDIS